jgi:Protein of unknwon function (DUF3310)
MTDVDMVNHPPHYRHPSGVQCIEITRLCHGNMSAYIQYIWRYDAKGTPEQDLAKARWYMRDTLANGLAQTLPYKARSLMEKVIVDEPNALKKSLLYCVLIGSLGTALTVINDEIGDEPE